MPSELMHLPPLYTLVGIYRLITDPSIRTPVLDKIKHASIRGIVVAIVYAIGSWRMMDWFIQRFLIGGEGGWFGFGISRKVGDVVNEGKSSGRGVVEVGVGGWKVPVDLVFYTHLLILLPQISSILRFFIYKNLRLARSRAYALTVSSRGKPTEFWNQGYIEEWANPPTPSRNDLAAGSTHRSREAKWISWLLWWPTQLIMRHYLFLPLSPTLPLLAPLATSLLRSLQAGEYLHTPYFDTKAMSPADRWRWIEERRWAYRSFGFAASLLESIPIIGLFLSISNRIGAAMWAFDLEKRQHLFSHGILKPLGSDQVGFLGMGKINDLGINIQAAEEEIEKQWTKKKVDDGQSFNRKADGDGEGGGEGTSLVELRGQGIGSSERGREKIL